MVEILAKDSYRVPNSESLNTGIEQVPALLRQREYEVVTVDSEEFSPVEVYVFQHSQQLPGVLPHGYGFMGGVARNVVLQELGEPVLPPRDMDVVAIRDWKPDLSLNTDLSRQYMRQDFSHGHGVGRETLASFFNTRDFRLNEVFVHGDKVYATKDALEDLEKKRIRPTKYEEERFELYDLDSDNEDASLKEGIRSRLVMKALRFQVEFEAQYGQGEISGIEDWQFEYSHIPLFEIALALNKAYQRGDALATRFYAKLLTIGTIDLDNGSPTGGESGRQLALNIQFGMIEESGSPFIFDRKEFNLENNQNLSDEEMYDHYADLANTYAAHNKIIDEY